MSLVTLCLGQCGNQLAVSLFETIVREALCPAAPAAYTHTALGKLFRCPSEGFESAVAALRGRAARAPSAAPVHESADVEAKPSRLEAALGLASRVRSKSASAGRGRPSPYAAPTRAPSKATKAVSSGRGGRRGGAGRGGEPSRESESGAFPSLPPMAPAPPPRLVARAVLVDMEPKVIRACCDAASASGAWAFDESQTFFKQGGSGNNWAHGYYAHGPACADDILKRVRKEVEGTTDFAGFLLLQSVAGGTGSGLGTFVTELLRREFPDAIMMNGVVCPYAAGEVCVQHYNSVLTLSKLVVASDCVMLLENDMASAVCKRLLNLASPSFDHLNRVLAKALAMLLLPCHTSTDERLDVRDLITRMCPHPGFRVVTARLLPLMPTESVPFSVHTWAGITKHLKQMQLTGSALEEGMSWRMTEASPGVNRSASAVVLLRGGDAGVALADAFTTFSAKEMYAEWADAAGSLTLCSSDVAFGGYDKSGACFSACGSTAALLDRTLALATEMFDAGAFLHQYALYGLSRDGFLPAFAALEQLLRLYQDL